MSGIRTDMGENPLISNNFLLRVDAVYDLPCRKISGMKQQKEYEPITQGGVNDYVYLREKQVQKPQELQIERYIGVGFFDPLPVGRQLQLPLVLYVSRYIDDFNEPKQTFLFFGCTVTAKSYSELDAEKSGLMVETTTIAYQYMKVMFAEPEIMPEAEWSFDPKGERYQGVGKRRAVYSKQETRLKDGKERARIWPETRSARTIKDIS